MQFQLTTIFSVFALMSGSVTCCPNPINPSTTSCLRAVSADEAAVEGVECLKV
ncbi:uncharacterized protein EAF02_002081 [Botrytis sinoallii]|uniref:uncharacterized protein n=1 Tax=Botrytis sinoallii TaxID=1463999 RepID=UPI001900C1B9|nr:uncharacterized protein EAF02_002081 [Botrytis sinoallii]KAF7889666.1 hypothetical protein EAF02_002081 [Botrytis sinoallii]